jgi:hypothetical protein
VLALFNCASLALPQYLPNKETWSRGGTSGVNLDAW